MSMTRPRPQRQRRGRTDWTTILLLSAGIAVVLWLLLGAPDVMVVAERRAGPAQPCAEPVAWTLADIDPRFGLPRQRALDAVLAATRLWEETAGRQLFIMDDEAGMPIRFVFDDRQAATLAAIHDGNRLRSRREEIEHERVRYDALHREFSALRSEFEERNRALQRDIDSHAGRIREWEARGAIPDRERSRLAAEAEAARREAAELRRLEDRLSELADRMDSHSGRLQLLVDRYNEEVRDYRDATPMRRMRSAVFERVSLAGRRGETERRITVYQFSDEQHLVLLLAHELGHALGLDHVDHPAAVMREEYEFDYGRPPTRLHGADLEALREICGSAW